MKIREQRKATKMEAVQVISRFADVSTPCDPPTPITATEPVSETQILSAFSNSFAEEKLDDATGLSLQREVAEIRRRYDLSGDLETLIREAREVDARLKKKDAQGDRENLVVEPVPPQVPFPEHPLASEFTAMMMRGPSSSTPKITPVPGDKKLATSLLSQEEPLQGLNNFDVASITGSHLTINQLTTDQQVHLLGQLQVMRAGERTSEESTSSDPRENKTKELLASLLFLKLQQESGSAPGGNQPGRLLSLVQQNFKNANPPFGLQSLQEPSLNFMQHSPALQQQHQASEKARFFAQEASHGVVSDLGPFPDSLLLSLLDSSVSCRPLELPQAVRDSGMLASQERERELALLLLLRQAHLLRQEARHQPSVGFVSASTVIADQNGQQHALMPLQVQLALKQLAQAQRVGDLDRFATPFQALHLRQSHDLGLPPPYDQLVELLLKAHQQRSSSPTDLALDAQLQILLQRMSQEAGSVSSPFQMPPPPVRPVALQQQPQQQSQQLQLLAMLKLLQDQQQRSSSSFSW
jgi:hypothetical protein